MIILLSILCVKKIKELKTLAQDSITQKNEQIIQEALAIYRGDNEGLCPIHLEALKGQYLENIPPTFDNGIENNLIQEGTNFEEIFDGTGGWLYINSIDKKSCEVLANL